MRDEITLAPQGFPDGFGRSSDAERDAALLLCGVQGSSPGKLHALAWREGSASACVRSILGGRAGTVSDRAYLAAVDPDDVHRALERAQARFVVPGDAEYWPAFTRLADPPVAVFARGGRLRLGEERIAIVGSRRPSPIGRDVTRDLARGVALHGLVVVSGGAIGIDAAAHEGCLDVGGRTVVVLGSGIDRLYPSSNRTLFEETLSAGGTVLSEYPPGVPAEPRRFPARNRLIAALSRGVVIVEGTRESGTRITADHAIDLGLDVFAVPGNVTSPLAYTPLELIRDGATMIRGAHDLLGDLGFDPGAVPAEGPEGLPEDERRALDTLMTPMLPESVAKAASMTVADAIAALIRLEIRGIVRGVGGRFERTMLAAAVGDG